MSIATLDWVSGFSDPRLLGPIGDIPPSEFEQMYYQQQQSRLVEAGRNKKYSPGNPGASEIRLSTVFLGNHMMRFERRK